MKMKNYTYDTIYDGTFIL